MDREGSVGTIKRKKSSGKIDFNYVDEVKRKLVPIVPYRKK